MSYPDEAKIKSSIEEIAKRGYCLIDGKTISEPQVIGNMTKDNDSTFKIISNLFNGFNERAIKLNIELYDKHARDLVVDALASVEDKDNG